MHFNSIDDTFQHKSCIIRRIESTYSETSLKIKGLIKKGFWTLWMQGPMDKQDKKNLGES